MDSLIERIRYKNGRIKQDLGEIRELRTSIDDLLTQLLPLLPSHVRSSNDQASTGSNLTSSSSSIDVPEHSQIAPPQHTEEYLIPQSGVTGVSWYGAPGGNYWVTQWHEQGKQRKELFRTGRITPDYLYGIDFNEALIKAIRRRRQKVNELGARSRIKPRMKYPPVSTIHAFQLPSELVYFEIKNDNEHMLSLIIEFLCEPMITGEAETIMALTSEVLRLLSYFIRMNIKACENMILTLLKDGRLVPMIKEPRSSEMPCYLYFPLRTTVEETKNVATEDIYKINEVPITDWQETGDVLPVASFENETTITEWQASRCDAAPYYEEPQTSDVWPGADAPVDPLSYGDALQTQGWITPPGGPIRSTNVVDPFTSENTQIVMPTLTTNIKSNQPYNGGAPNEQFFN